MHWAAAAMVLVSQLAGADLDAWRVCLTGPDGTLRLRVPKTVNVNGRAEKPDLLVRQDGRTVSVHNMKPPFGRGWIPKPREFDISVVPPFEGVTPRWILGLVHGSAEPLQLRFIRTGALEGYRIGRDTPEPTGEIWIDYTMEGRWGWWKFTTRGNQVGRRIELEKLAAGLVESAETANYPCNVNQRIQ